LTQSIRKVCFITNGYPSAQEPFKYNFLEQVVNEISKLEIKCVVINPVSLTHYFGKHLPPVYRKKEIDTGTYVEVYCPRYISFSIKRIWKLNTASWTLSAFTAAIESSLFEQRLAPDALYAHFIFPAGLAASILSKKQGILSFGAVGEGAPWSIDILGASKTRQILGRNINLFAVSPGVKKMLEENDLGGKEEIKIFPNGVNLETFHPFDRKAMREKYGFPTDGFIVAFVGKFSHGKGILRLIEAIRGLEGVYGLFIGDGSVVTEPATTLFKGPLPHEEIPLMLSAADIFVLPTLVEGSSNAIIEALACGLPVVSANYGFNDGVLTDENSIRIDPLNIQEIREAIVTLKQNPEKKAAMAKAASAKAESLDIRKRAAAILTWMEDNVRSTGKFEGK
jgi:glycosyltransferase involved in cell wall biosynthesis